MYISVDQLKASASRYRALTNDNAPEEIALQPPTVKGEMLSDTENLAKRKDMLVALKKEPVDFAFERVIGNNDSVYSNFVELIRNAKQKVGRIAIKDGAKNLGFATGFMVARNLLLTNWHVFNSEDDVRDSEIQFFYELDVQGNPGSPVSFRFQTTTFFYSNKDLDFCIVAVCPTDITGKTDLKSIGYIYLDPAMGKIGDENEALNIIHHPDGDYKQLSIRENLFKKMTPTTVWYETDTAPGSSGSPVFNDQWQVVALHHMGVASQNANGDYIDKDGHVLLPVNGKIDASKIVWIANEGIRISVILKDLAASDKGKPALPLLQNPPVITSREIASSALQPTPPINPKTVMESTTDATVKIEFPSALVEKSGSVSVTINQNAGSVVSPATKTPLRTIAAESSELSAEEIKKLETSTDYSACKGYESNFLGKSIPLPQPQQSIRNSIATVSGGGIELKYYHYSTIFHSVRKVPLISAINVDGDPAKRMDKSKRKDVWLRDSRVSQDIQLSEAYYKGSGFDRGHMSRREDADWGDTADDAKRNADLTCMFTNACPQVPKINQSSRKGLWGILEKVVLESGAEAEKGKTAKISVFNGPLFENNDPVFRQVPVPMSFFKIVLWLTDKGGLKATAFKLSQQNLVQDINFEELDLDKNTEFKEYQCSIKSLQNDTKIDFSGIIAFDTFDGAGEQVELDTEATLKTHLRKHSKG